MHHRLAFLHQRRCLCDDLTAKFCEQTILAVQAHLELLERLGLVLERTINTEWFSEQLDVVAFDPDELVRTNTVQSLVHLPLTEDVRELSHHHKQLAYLNHQPFRRLDNLLVWRAVFLDAILVSAQVRLARLFRHAKMRLEPEDRCFESVSLVI